MTTTPHNPQRGFTLLIAIILSTVALVVGLALADVAYKQVVLSSTARNSQVAFYRADSAMECALYYDQQFAAFSVGSTFNQATMSCGGTPPINYVETALSDGGVKTIFDVPCATGDRSATVTIYKQTSGTCTASGAKNCFYATGFNSCFNSAPNRFERGVKAFY
jgi:Tfp pilus assembly protein PilX